MGIRGSPKRYEVLRGDNNEKIRGKGGEVILNISGTAATKYFYSYLRPKNLTHIFIFIIIDISYNLIIK